MDLRYIIWVVLLLYILLLGTSLGDDLPLVGRKLPEVTYGDLPKSINCGKAHRALAVVGNSINPSNILKINSKKFRDNAFTAATLNLTRSSLCGDKQKFVFTKLKGIKTAEYALKVDKENGERAYWLPMNGHIMIPRIPTDKDPKYVFTPDLSGSSLTVTPSCSGLLHLRHVPSGKASKFNTLKPEMKGGAYTYALQYPDYGHIELKKINISVTQGFAYMHYSDGRWNLHVQSKACASTYATQTIHAGQNHRSVTSLEYTRKTIKSVPKAYKYTIPQVKPEQEECPDNLKMYETCKKLCPNEKISNEELFKSCPSTELI